jgi:hypothetical protein
MSIFEDKKHNSLKYIGQKPVMVPQIPEDTSNGQWGIVDHTVFQNASVLHAPNGDGRSK